MMLDSVLDLASNLFCNTCNKLIFHKTLPKRNSNGLIDLSLNYSFFFLHSCYESISLPDTVVKEIDMKTSNTKLIISNEAPGSIKYLTDTMLYIHKNLNSSEMK